MLLESEFHELFCLKFSFKLVTYWRAMLCKRGLCHHVVSVCVVTFVVHSIKTNKHIFEIFSPSGSQAIFPY